MSRRTTGQGGADARHRGERRFRALAYLLGSAVTALALVRLHEGRDLVRQEAVAVAIFALHLALSWFFSFTLFDRARVSVSIDVAFLMTALCALPEPLPLAVALAGGLFGSLLRHLDRETRVPEFLPTLSLNTGALVLAAFVGQRVARALGTRADLAHLSWETVAALALLYVAYGVTNVTVMGTAVALRGESLRRYLGHYLRYVPTVEIFVLPLALGMTLLYAASGIWGFAPLGGTVVIASGLLKNLNRVRRDLSHANEDLQRRTRELRIVNTIGREISTSLDPRVVFGRVAAHLERILDAPYLFLSLRQRGATESYVEFIARDGQVQPASERPLGEGFTHWAVEARRALLLSDLSVDRDALPCVPLVLDPGVRCLAAAPLVVQGEAIGVLSVQSRRPGAYSVDQMSVLTTIAQQAAIAIENARNFQLATVDQLTGLYLRDFFLRKLEEERARARRYGSPFAILMIDVDLFKEINDRLGHLAGDRFLVGLTTVLRETLRAADVPCRWGGDEFAVLLPESDRDGARAIAERIRARIAEGAISVGDQAIRATVSVGVACHPLDESGADTDLLDRADAAQYAAKQAGRNRVMLAGEAGAAAIADPGRRSAARAAG